MGEARKWTSEDRLRVVFLFNNGHSASQVAKEYGVSRNSVLGVVHRARQTSDTPIRSRRLTRRARKSAKVRISPPKQHKPRPIVHAADENPVPFLERADNQCAYPLWPDDAPRHDVCDGMVCGAPVDRSSRYGPAYCSFHLKRIAAVRSDA